MQDQSVAAVRIESADLSDPVHQMAVVQLLDDYAADRMGGNAPLPVTTRNRLIGALRAHPTTHVLLAFRESQAVGVAICFLGFSTFTARPLLNIHDLAVEPVARGHGVGRRLLVAAESLARQLGCCRIALEVREDNRIAKHLYEDSGFAPATVGGELLELWEKPL